MFGLRRCRAAQAAARALRRPCRPSGERRTLPLSAGRGSARPEAIGPPQPRRHSAAQGPASIATMLSGPRQAAATRLEGATTPNPSQAKACSWRPRRSRERWEGMQKKRSTDLRGDRHDARLRTLRHGNRRVGERSTPLSSGTCCPQRAGGTSGRVGVHRPRSVLMHRIRGSPPGGVPQQRPTEEPVRHQWWQGKRNQVQLTQPGRSLLQRQRPARRRGRRQPGGCERARRVQRH